MFGKNSIPSYQSVLCVKAGCGNYISCFFSVVNYLYFLFSQNEEPQCSWYHCENEPCHLNSDGTNGDGRHTFCNAVRIVSKLETCHFKLIICGGMASKAPFVEGLGSRLP